MVGHGLVTPVQNPAVQSEPESQRTRGAGTMATSVRPQSLKERQRQEREQLILQAADELLLEKGYHDTSIEDIAARVGISKGTVYLHFTSKENLVIALFERGARKMLDTLNAILAAPGTSREKLRAIILQIYGAMDRQRFQVMGALFSSPEFHRSLAEWRQRMGELWAEPRRRVTALFEEGKAAGEFDRTIPTPVLLSLFWSILSPHTYRQLVTEEHMPVNTVADHVSQFFFKGLAPGGVCCPVPTDTHHERE